MFKDIDNTKRTARTTCIQEIRENKKGIKFTNLIPFTQQVGMTGFEPATTRPPDAYSNRAELHPALFLRVQK